MASEGALKAAKKLGSCQAFAHKNVLHLKNDFCDKWEASEMDSNSPVENTDRELWRERDDYYADSIHVTKGGGIGINCGGHVIVLPLKLWHAAAKKELAVASPSPSVPSEPDRGYDFHGNPPNASEPADDDLTAEEARGIAQGLKEAAEGKTRPFSEIQAQLAGELGRSGTCPQCGSANPKKKLCKFKEHIEENAVHQGNHFHAVNPRNSFCVECDNESFHSLSENPAKENK